MPPSKLKTKSSSHFVQLASESFEDIEIIYHMYSCLLKHIYIYEVLFPRLKEKSILRYIKTNKTDTAINKNHNRNLLN